MTEQHETYPNGLEALCLIAVLFLVEMIIATAIDSAGWFTAADDGDVGGLITVAGNGVLFCALLAYKRLDYRSLFHPARHSVLATLGVLSIPVLMIVPGILFGVSVINAFLVTLFPLSSYEEAMFESMVGGGFVTALFTCIVAPVLEEMLFRGIILRSFLRQYSRGAAIWGSAALFGFAHLNIYQFATGLVIGVAAGWLYERSRSLWPCIVLHAANNTAVTYLAAWDSDVDYLALIAVALVSTALGAFLLSRLLRARPTSAGL